MGDTTRKRHLLAVLVLAAGFLWTGRAVAQSKGETTLSGTVSDSMCGADHSMMGKMTPKECTLACVKSGAKYVLVVGTKIYTLEGKAADFEKFAGGKAKVTGTVQGNTLKVSSIGPAS